MIVAYAQTHTRACTNNTRMIVFASTMVTHSSENHLHEMTIQVAQQAQQVVLDVLWIWQHRLARINRQIECTRCLVEHNQVEEIKAASVCAQMSRDYTSVCMNNFLNTMSPTPRGCADCSQDLRCPFLAQSAKEQLWYKIKSLTSPTAKAHSSPPIDSHFANPRKNFSDILPVSPAFWVQTKKIVLMSLTGGEQILSHTYSPRQLVHIDLAMMTAHLSMAAFNISKQVTIELCKLLYLSNRALLHKSSATDAYQCCW